jgi:hypothetical protein
MKWRFALKVLDKGNIKVITSDLLSLFVCFDEILYELLVFKTDTE